MYPLPLFLLSATLSLAPALLDPPLTSQQTLAYSAPSPTLSADAAFTLVMETEAEKRGKSDPDASGMMTITCEGDVTGLAIAIGGTRIQAIINSAEKTITSITTGKKGDVTAMKMPMINLGRKSLDDLGLEYAATGEIRTILGYTAEKYIITSKQGTTESWIGNVPGVDWRRFADAMVGSRQGGSALLLPDLDKFEFPVALESHTTDRDGKSVHHQYVREIKLDAQADRTLLSPPAGVEIQDLSGFLKN